MKPSCFADGGCVLRFERRVTSATKLLCRTAEGDHVRLPSDVIHKQRLYQQRGVSRCTAHVCYVRPLATGCISYKSTSSSWQLISQLKQRCAFTMRPLCQVTSGSRATPWSDNESASRVHFFPLLSGNVHGYEIDFAPRRINRQPSLYISSGSSLLFSDLTVRACCPFPYLVCERLDCLAAVPSCSPSTVAPCLQTAICPLAMSQNTWLVFALRGWAKT